MDEREILMGEMAYVIWEKGYIIFENGILNMRKSYVRIRKFAILPNPPPPPTFDLYIYQEGSQASQMKACIWQSTFGLKNGTPIF